MKVRIIGAGFSGLAIGYALCKQGVKVDIYDTADEVGGLLGSKRFEWGLVESAANGIRASRSVVELFHDLDLQYMEMKKQTKKRYIIKKGQPRQLPLGIFEFLRFCRGLLRRPQPQAGQSLADYAKSAFGPAAAEFLIEPAMFGIFADRIQNLSASLIYNYFVKHKSVSTHAASGTLAPQEGMGALCKAMKLYIEKSGGSFHLGQSAQLLETGPTVIATDSRNASLILRNSHESLSNQLAEIKYLPLSSISLAYRKTRRSLKAFGCLFPASEGFSSLGVLFNNDIYDHRGPYITETWMLAKEGFTEQQCREAVLSDRAQLLGYNEDPDEVIIQMWPQALPQYSTQLESILDSLELPESVYLVGNYMGRIGLAKILDQCHETANRIVKYES